jgi:predicted RNA-binding Zn-ribbon protein involved in translation (DUF1610 family)
LAVSSSSYSNDKLANDRFEAHTPGMNSEAQKAIVVFACPKCGAIYQATQYQVPDTRFGIFNCLACHTQIHAWHRAYDFSDWRVGFMEKSPDDLLARFIF